MKTWTALAILLPITVAAGTPPHLVIASGNCREDPDLIELTRRLSDEFAARGATPISVTEIRRQLNLPSPQGLKDLERQLNSEHDAFYSAENSSDIDHVRRQVYETLKGIEQLPPSPEHFDLWVRANLLEGLLLQQRDHWEEADQAFARVLTIAPDWALDPDQFSPSTRDRFERLRSQLPKRKRHRLVVRSLPPGAEVALFGKAVGVSPWTDDLPAGRFLFQLSAGGALSFPHELNLTQDSTLVVDLGFEGAIDLSRVACISEKWAGGDWLGKAARLGSLMGIGEVVVVRTERSAEGSVWLAATLLNVERNQTVREGRLKVSGSSNPPDGLSDLAQFLNTGRVEGRVVAGAAGIPKAPVARTLQPVEAPSARPWLISGGALIAVGLAGTIYGLGVHSSVEDQLAGRRTDISQSTAKTGSVLFDAGFAASAIGAGLVSFGIYRWLSKPVPVALAPTRGGAIAAVGGAF